MKYDRNRLINTIGIFLLAISFASYVMTQSYFKYIDFSIGPEVLMGVSVTFLTGLTLFMYSYLRGGQKQDAPKHSNASGAYSSDSQKIDDLGDSIENLIDRLSNIEQAIRHSSVEESSLTEKDRIELIDTFKKRLSENVTDDFLKAINMKYGKAIANNILMDELGKHCDRTETRLRNEIESLTRRGNINLVIGVLTTLIAVGILASTVVMNSLPTDPEKLAAHFLPRFTLSIFIEIFSFFFLRLYNTSLNDIKYFQNELTNIESRFIALRQATQAGDEKTLGMLLNNLGETERNFVLKKGETTADLEKSKLDQQSMKEMLVAFVDTVKTEKK
jgi:hypothetical protein